MTKLRLALVLAFVSLPLLAARIVALRATAPRSFDAHSLPDRIAAHRLVHEQELEAETLAMLEPASYAMRLYSDDRDSSVWVYFAIYSGTDTTGAHDPTVCYPAQGWDTHTPQERVLVAADGESMSIKTMGASLGGKEERVLYWFQPAARWPTSTPREQLLRMWDGLAGRPQYGFVRLSSQVSQPGEEAIARVDARLAEIALALAPTVRQAVTGDAGSKPR